MAAVTVTGARTTGGIYQAIRKIDMSRTVMELEPNAAPLTVLSNRLGKEPTVNSEYSWVEDDLEPRFTAINNGAGYNDSATSIVVDNGGYAYGGALAKVTATGEVMRVTAVSTNTWTVVRGVGGGAAAITDNDEVLIIGSALHEGSDPPAARSGNPTKVTNYTEIVRTTFEATGTLRSSEQMVAPSDWTRQANHKGIEHQKSWEYLAWFGKPSENLTGGPNGEPLRTTGGVLHFLSTNITDAAGTLSEDEFFSFFSPSFRYGSQDSKMLFASRLVVDVLNRFPRSKLSLIQSDNDKTYGLNIMRFVSPHGTMGVVTHNLFEGAKYGGMAACLDMAQIKARPLSGGDGGSRDTHIEESIQPNGRDTRMDGYLTERGMQVGLEKTHSLLEGVTG
jgi:uncharacterized protein DUF5309